MRQGHGGLPVGLLRDVVAHEHRVLTALGCQRLAGGFVHVADEHARTFAQQQQHHLTAHTTGPAGDQGDFVFYLSHATVLGSGVEKF